MTFHGRDLRLDLSGEDVRLLHDKLGRLGLVLPETERREGLFGPATHEAVAGWQRDHGVEPTGVVDTETAAGIGRALEGLRYAVGGTVASPNRASVGDLRVQIVDKNVGHDVPLAEAKTDEQGRYEVNFAFAIPARDRRKAQPDLQAQVWVDQTLLAASEVRYNATNRETLDVLLPAGAALRSEHETLTSAIEQHYGGRLGDLQESDTRQDITYLANKTGWDARAVALAALADQFNRQTPSEAQAIPPALYYALFRAGIPANADAVYGIDPATIGGIWKRAIDGGVVPSELATDLDRSVEAFQSLRAAHALDARALTGASSLKEMLGVTLGDDTARQQRFAELYTLHADNLPEFWKEVGGAFGEDMANRLHLDGALGFMTLNNAPLIKRLHEAEGANALSTARDLAERGYFRADRWNQLLEGDAPEQIPGATPAEKRANYADLLATQVRLSFPTTVVAEQVRSGEIPLTDDPGVREGVHAFLAEHQDTFAIGMHPIDQYIARNKLGETIDASVRDQIKRIQRVYQITPTDQAMSVLLGKNLDSAYQIVRYDQEEFVQTFKDELGGEAAAGLTYAKSVQVHNAVLNIASSYLTSRRALGLGADPEALVLGPASNGAGGAGAGAPLAADVVAYPTLEGLFGSLDFCDCDHCRSILSPAAYLVDLLLFIDRPVNEKENPQAVLLERRPDLQSLPLTCENTNTPLPYIDLVNETLEYFVANQLSLTGYGGHDTGDFADAAELLATPQYVDEAAYDTLRAELFPPPMPFDKPLELLRRCFRKFGVALEGAMEALRTDDAIERANAASYGWRDILMEELGLSRAEYPLLTDRALTLQQLYGYPPATPDADVLSGLSNVKSFARRVGVTYADVVEILKTGFINPSSTLIPRLERLGVTFEDLKGLKDGTISDADFVALLAPGVDPVEFGGDIKAWVKDPANYARIMGLITISNPKQSDDLCSIDDLEFRYADPDFTGNSLREIDFVRLLRFIRLWRALGWTVEETGKAITALYPAAELPTGTDDAADLQHLDNGFLSLLPRLGVLRLAMNRLRLKPAKDLLSLLVCWSPIDTNGANALYRTMFINPAIQGQDAAFADDGYGNVLADAGQKLLEHAEALRAAFSLTADEFSLILDELGFDATSPLTLDNVSAIYRRGWLARKLRLSVREFLLLVAETIDPFAEPDPPNPPLLKFVEWVQALRAASLKPVQALYLIWNQDISGKSAPDDRQITDFARTLRADFAHIEGEYVVADDPNGDIARARMALVYGTDATDFFFGLLGDTFAVDVPYAHPEATLEQPILDAAPGRISYDDFRKRLSYTGILSTAGRDALKAVAGVSGPFQAAVDALYTADQVAVGPFFGRDPELLPLYTAFTASTDPPETKRTALLANFLPELKRRRKRQQALSSVSAATRSDTVFAQTVLDDATVLHSAADPAKAALDDLTAVDTTGLSVQFFWRDTASGNVDSTVDAAPTLGYSATGSTKLPANPTPGSAISGIWSGYLEAPESAFFNIAIETEAGATVSVTLSGQAVTLVQSAGTWSNQSPISLTAGTLYQLTLRAERVKDTLAVRWETTGRGWEVIPAQYLYSASLVDHLRSTYIRLLKIASLAASLKMTANEVQHFASHADYQIGGQGWLNALAVSGLPNATTSHALRDVLAALLDFARIKADLSPDDERLLTVLQDPNATPPNGDNVLLTLAGWDTDSLNALLARFGEAIADLGHLDSLRRIHDAYALVTTFGISASAMIEATTNEPGPTTVRDMLAALHARYEEAALLDVIKSINDELRGLQRDALVAYVLQKLSENPATSHIDTPDKLFEYFLMDVEMDPCMQTSRVRNALSSTQLFIERCLMNLEPRVAPTSIRANQWAWMKRYRVWEANRKVFLWPENWLEPELRDDQSPFFRQSMSELLQSDITEDAAATALLNYLSKLEEVAKLEPCGIYFAENDSGTADDIAHVVARTAGAHRKYYYRRCEYGYWTPWEQIKLDIEDNPVCPVLWKSRLFLFWLRILKKTAIDPSAQPTTSSKSGNIASLSLSDLKSDAGADAKTKARVTVQAVLCWSEYFNGKWQPARTSDVNRPTELGQFDTTGQGAFDRSSLRLSVAEEGDALRISIEDAGWSSFLLYNTHSLPLPEEDAPTSFTIGGTSPTRNLSTWMRTFTIYYHLKPSIDSGFPDPTVKTRPVLKNDIGDGTMDPRHPLKNVWDAPFFYEDSRHVFYVTTKENVVTISQFDGYGIGGRALKPRYDLPPLVLKEDPFLKVIPDKHGPIIHGPGFGVVDPAQMKRFVTEDVNIRAGIGTNASVRYGNKEFGPEGALSERGVQQQ